MNKVFNKIFGSDSVRYLKKITPLINKINSLEDKYSKSTNEEIKEMTKKFKQQLAEGKEEEEILPDVFAVIREASKRVSKLRHFDVQLIGGIVLNDNMIAEMKTGEGKTLVSTLPAYLNALYGKGVHIVTVNEYLAQRDAETMRPLYEFLGLTVGVISAQMDKEDRKKAYACDITYGTNSEFAFDYLRDNMAASKSEQVQRGLFYSIVDEVDSILIDEARTPLIIANPQNENTGLLPTIVELVKNLTATYKQEDERMTIAEQIKQKISKEESSEEVGDILIFEKDKNAILTEKGAKKVESLMKIDNLFVPELTGLLHLINKVILAMYTMKKDIDYIVENGEVLIVDEFTGRVMYGRRFTDGLHQAIEAKENLKIKDETHTVASITYQNFFKMYEKLGGMTGTAETEADEFDYVYGLAVIVIPTNKPVLRADQRDRVFKTEEGKIINIIEDINDCYDRGQPVLVGTISVEKSEQLSKELTKKGIPHKVLNAKNHKQEADIIAQAGRYKSITIATNMAGRGTDILLGGNPVVAAKQIFFEKYHTPIEDIENLVEEYEMGSTEEITLETYKEYKDKELEYEKLLNEQIKKAQEEKNKVITCGGLRVVGTTRHESRRIDNQLSGRSGRQGDVGSSVFYLSFEDDLLKLFGGQGVKTVVESLNIDETAVIQSKTVDNIIEKAQKAIESNNFDIRKSVLDYDSVLDKHREIIYAERQQVLDSENIDDMIIRLMNAFAETIVNRNNGIDENGNEQYDYEGLVADLQQYFNLNDITEEDLKLEVEVNDGYTSAVIVESVKKIVNERLDLKRAEIGTKVFSAAERNILLHSVTMQWQDHLDAMDRLKKSINFITLGQSTEKDPKIIYSKEAFELFEYLKNKISEETFEVIFRVQLSNDAKKTTEEIISGKERNEI